MALEAGNDVLLFPGEIPESIAKIKRFVSKGRIPLTAIESKCRKILVAKYYAGLSTFIPIDTTNVVNDLNTTESELLKRKISREAITLVSNHHNFIPIQRLDTLSIAYLEIDPGMGSSFIGMVGQTKIELLESTDPEGPIGKFIEKKGEGIHHMAFAVEGIENALADVESKGVQLIDKTPRHALLWKYA